MSSNYPPGVTDAMIEAHFGDDNECPHCGCLRVDKGGDEPVCDNPCCPLYERDLAAEAADAALDAYMERDLF